MNSNFKKTSQALALFLTCAVAQVYLLATPTAFAATAEEGRASTVERSALLLGKLSVYGEGGVTINGNVVTSGTTVFSGAHLRTGEMTGATLSLGAVGGIEIAPNTSLTVTFDRKQISVRLTKGDALLSTNEGVKGALTTPDGKTELTDGMTASLVGSGMFAEGDPADPQTTTTQSSPRILGLRRPVFFVLLASSIVATILIVRAVRRGGVVSPFDFPNL